MYNSMLVFSFSKNRNQSLSPICRYRSARAAKIANFTLQSWLPRSEITQNDLKVVSQNPNWPKQMKWPKQPKWSKVAKSCPNGQKSQSGPNSLMCQKWPTTLWENMGGGGPKWFKLAQNSRRWLKLPKKNSKKIYMAQSDPKWPKVVQSGPKWSKVAQSGPKWPKVALSGPE